MTPKPWTPRFSDLGLVKMVFILSAIHFSRPGQEKGKVVEVEVLPFVSAQPRCLEMVLNHQVRTGDLS